MKDWSYRPERFWMKVDKTPFDNGCWLWIGGKSTSGYGQFWNGKKRIPAHWFLLETKPNRKIGEEACHRCDNKLCVRPSHIFIGTRSDNMRDCRDKGRLRPLNGLAAANKTKSRICFGERNHQHKLTNNEADLIRSTPYSRGIQAKLARRFGVSETVISGIRNGTRWLCLSEHGEIVWSPRIVTTDKATGVSNK